MTNLGGDALLGAGTGAATGAVTGPKGEKGRSVASGAGYGAAGGLVSTNPIGGGFVGGLIGSGKRHLSKIQRQNKQILENQNKAQVSSPVDSTEKEMSEPIVEKIIGPLAGGKILAAGIGYGYGGHRAGKIAKNEYGLSEDDVERARDKGQKYGAVGGLIDPTFGLASGIIGGRVAANKVRDRAKQRDLENRVRAMETKPTENASPEPKKEGD